MTDAGTDAATAGASFETHLQSLRDFADTLRQQVSALTVTREAVEALAAHDVLLGDFLEADLLLARHDEAVEQARALVLGIREALVFAEQVTGAVADSYEREDAEVAALYGGTAGAV